MNTIINGFLLSLSYFSIIRVKIKEFKPSKNLYATMLFSFPIVGLILASLTLLFYFLFQNLYNSLYVGFLSAILYLILYGFIHLEAVCDVVDGWFASFGNKDIYSIMKEPHIGAMGAIGAFIVVLLKVTIIAYLFYMRVYWAFIFSIVFSRLYLFYILYFFDFHKNSTLLYKLKNSLSLKFLLFTFLLYLFVFSYFFCAVEVLILFVIGIVTIHLTIKYLSKKFGFLNGDCIGFSIEIVEIVLLNIGLLL